MHILIIQPPDLEKDFQGISQNLNRVIPFSPPWPVLCLRQYFEDRTRHIASYLDTRLFASVEQELASALSDFQAAQLAVIHCTNESIGSAAGITNLLQQYRPDIQKVLIGSFPTAFPERALDIPYVDFAISGDPEHPLKLLADNLDAPKLWQHVPGLIFPGHLPESPFVWNNLNRRGLPGFTGIFWGAYKCGPGNRGPCISASLSYGHTGLPCDRAYGPVGQPLRIEDLDRMADCVQHASHLEIESIHFEDPPGIWSPDRLTAWCNALIRCRNTQPWSFCMLPAYLDPDMCERLHMSQCREIVFQVPSTHSAELKKYGCIIQPSLFKRCMDELEARKIRPILHFLAGGPAHAENETKGIQQWLHALDFPAYSITPFPLLIDSPIYLESLHVSQRVHLEQRLRWARAPWSETRPLPLWGGPDDLKRIQTLIHTVQQQDQRSLRRRLRSALQQCFGRNTIQAIEDWTASLIPKTKPKHHF